MNYFITEKEICQILKLESVASKKKVEQIMNILSIKRLNLLYDEISIYNGLEFIDKAIEKLDIRYNVYSDYTNIIPKHGPFIIISNHPLGGIDGLILLKLICRIRPDFKIQGNFILTNIEPLRDYIFPVNPFEELKSQRSSYSGIKGALEHLAAGKPLGLFPAGEVSSFQSHTMSITDRKWQPSSVKMIRSSGVRIIPVLFGARNSMRFYLAGMINPLFRTAMLPSEIMKSSHRRINLYFGEPVNPETINSFNTINDLSDYLRNLTYSLNKTAANSYFFLSRPRSLKMQNCIIADPVNSLVMQSEIDKLPEKCLLLEKNNLAVYCSKASGISNILTEIGRLREITFRSVGEGSNKALDLDKFDSHYYHLFLWDRNTQQIAGAYRIGHGSEIMSEFGITGFYISSLFRLKAGFADIISKSAELGRSFILKEYQRQHFPLLLLWKGIFQFMKLNQELKYIIGPVSISNDYSAKNKSLIVNYINRFYFNSNLAKFVKPTKPFIIPYYLQIENALILEDMDSDIRAFEKKLSIIQPGFEIPVLLKKYLAMNGNVICFNIDASFNNCLDALMIAAVEDLPFEMRIQLSKDTKLQSNNRLSASSRHNMKQVYS